MTHLTGGKRHLKLLISFWSKSGRLNPEESHEILPRGGNRLKDRHGVTRMDVGNLTLDGYLKNTGLFTLCI